MGTNYYLWKSCVVPSEDNVNEGIHLGKNSAGWVFHFQAHKELNVTNLKQMKEFTKEGKIYNEYAEPIKYNYFWEMVNSSLLPDEFGAPYVLVDPNYPSDYIFDDYEESGFAWSNNDFS